MTIERVIRSIQDYLEEESVLLECAPSTIRREALTKEIERARQDLYTELAAFEQWRRADRPFRRVLVGIDGSERSAWALNIAVRTAKATCARVALVHVVPEPVPANPEFGYVPTSPAELEAEGRALLKQAREQVGGLPVEEIMEEGDAADRIVAAAKEWNADLVVIGTHARSGLGRLVLGSTAESIVRHAHCPVLTIAHEPPVPGTPALAVQRERRVSPAKEASRALCAS